MNNITSYIINFILPIYKLLEHDGDYKYNKLKKSFNCLVNFFLFKNCKLF